LYAEEAGDEKIPEDEKVPDTPSSQIRLTMAFSGGRVYIIGRVETP
jgi:hypothetical protein